jgi:hypothetical protein
MGSNSRRRTISKPSSAVAGRHEDSTRPTTLRSRSSASRLHVVGLSVRRTRCVGGGQRDNEQAILRELGRLGQRLSEGELRLKPARRQIALVVQLAGIGYPFIDQHELTWPASAWRYGPRMEANIVDLEIRGYPL